MDLMVQSVQKWVNATYKGNSGYTPVTEDGITGGTTEAALITALQIEIGISSPDGVFGPSTKLACPTLPSTGAPKNIIYIIQGALYCKGYNPNGLDGGYGNGVITAIKKFQSDAGLTTQDGITSPMIFQALLNTDAFVLISNGDSNIRTVQKNLNRDYNSIIGLMPCDGVYSRSTNVALIKALQHEQGNSPDGIWGVNTMNACPTVPGSNSTQKFILLLQYALYCNGFDPNGFDGLFGAGLETAITNFQYFSGLTADGYSGGQTWASLLVSTGDNTRRGTACDCATTITSEKAATLKNNGYEIVGRYLTGNYKMTSTELQTIFASGLKVFPIYETSGTYLSDFSTGQGILDANLAINASRDLGFDSETIIYFAVDYDAIDSDIDSNIMDYFKAINDEFNKLIFTKYKIGIYGPRNVCSRIKAVGYSNSSFVCDMSTGFSGNLGYSLPNDWAFDQIATITIGSGTGAIEIDNNICSGKDIGVSKTNINALIFQSARKKGLDDNGYPADDMKINDFTKDELLAINSVFQYQLDESNDPEILFSEWKDMSTSLFSQGEMEDVILDMINHFKSGEGTDYRNSVLTKNVSDHESTITFIAQVKDALINELVKNGGNLLALEYNIMNSNNPLYSYLKANANLPVFNLPGDILGGLTITINDTWGNNVEVRNYSVDDNIFRGTLHFNIYDHFGLDLPDVEKIYVDLAGFRSWFVLQHYDQYIGKYKPFATVMEIDVPFEGILF
ncbi:DUF3289 family protein [Clostridium sp.]|uniref:DUF3289 family protein n=1 Tax=Clostridium sp. TaxID=1506 RepID=UPI003D6CA376